MLNLAKPFILILFISSLFLPKAHATGFKAAGFSFNKRVKPMTAIKQENVVIQSLDFTCGAAGLSTLLNYYHNDPVSEAEIIEAMEQIVTLEKAKARGGFTLLDIKKFAQALGYRVTGYRMDDQFLKGLKKPVLVPIKFKNFRHFVIVKGIVADRVFIADPASGNLTMKLSKFRDYWLNGIGLVIESEDPDKARHYALRIEEEDFLVADYRRMKSLVDHSLISNTVRPHEW